MWDQAGPIAGTTAERYLAARGLAGFTSPALRFLPDQRHGTTGSRWPVMLAACTCRPRHLVRDSAIDALWLNWSLMCRAVIAASMRAPQQDDGQGRRRLRAPCRGAEISSARPTCGNRGRAAALLIRRHAGAETRTLPT